MTVEQDQRQAVVDEAISWLKTPHHHQGRVKGIHGGVDCLMLLGEVFHRVSLIDRLPDIQYSPDGHLHREEELVLVWMERYAYRIGVSEVLPADLVVYKYGRRYSHGGIIIAWPRIIHAVLNRAVEYGHVDKVSSNGHRPSSRLFYRFNNWRSS